MVVASCCSKQLDAFVCTLCVLHTACVGLNFSLECDHFLPNSLSCIVLVFAHAMAFKTAVVCIACGDVCHDFIGPRLVLVRADKIELPKIVRADQIYRVIWSHVAFFGPT